MRIDSYEVLPSGEHILKCIGEMNKKTVGFNLIIEGDWQETDWQHMPPDIDRNLLYAYQLGSTLTKIYPESINLDRMLVDLYELAWVDSIFADPGYGGGITVREEEMQAVPFRLTLSDAMLVGEFGWRAEMAIDLKNRNMVVFFRGVASRSSQDIVERANQIVETMRTSRTSH